MSATAPSMSGGRRSPLSPRARTATTRTFREKRDNPWLFPSGRSRAPTPTPAARSGRPPCRPWSRPSRTARSRTASRTARRSSRTRRAPSCTSSTRDARSPTSDLGGSSALEESADRGILIERLGVDIDPGLLELALTHRSYAYEHGGLPHNERLEFLGDSILGKAVTVQLFNDNPDLDEGDLAKRRASLVSSVALAEIARTLGLGAFLRLRPRAARTRGGAHARTP